ncbi:MAG: nuclear transport factor 2 family protein [Gemmatimonadetes bacterium]|nr:nuclear transport factor 2 family protein [Gemmatimonadota bacterium]
MLRLALVSLVALSLPAGSPTSAEIDAQVWSAVAASVVAGDIVAMGRTYHPAAVLVSNTGTKPIATTLADWGKDMVTAKKDGVRATVELRFDKRQDDATTAFEIGAFKYTTTDRAGKQTPSIRRMETLLVKTNGRWQIVMERQLDAITEAAWNQLPH